MNAIYGRQSIDKKDSISIESQIEFCKYETRGEEYKVYSDKGYSGKNTDRPQFKQMVEDIKNGEIKRVIVYRLDRISRSILDFAEMMEMFEQYHVEFVSSTEKFDTSTPMGRAMLNICIVFAQLERETIQQRVVDAYRERSRHGFYMGGRVPYGFTREQTVIDGIKTSKYIIVPEEAEQVKTIFNMYANPTISMTDVLHYLKENGMENLRGEKHKWCKSTISSMLKNPSYVCADLDVYDFFKSQNANIVNPPSDFIGLNGCYLYTDPNSKDRKNVKLEGHTLVVAPHEGFIPSDIWLKARDKCLKNKEKKRGGNKAKNTWLAGKIKCGRCGYALISHKSDITPYKSRFYFRCQRQRNYYDCEGVKSLYLDTVESVVCNEMREKLKEFKQLASKDNSEIVNPILNELKVKEKQVDREIENLMNKLPDANEVLMQYINKRIEELDKRKREIQQEIYNQSIQKISFDLQAITDHMDKWDVLSFDDKRNVVDMLIEKVTATEDNISIVWRI